MNNLLIYILVYAYIHYGTMFLFWAMGVYTGNRKEMFLDLIPFYWIIKETKKLFRKTIKIFRIAFCSSVFYL